MQKVYNYKYATIDSAWSKHLMNFNSSNIISMFVCVRVCVHASGSDSTSRQMLLLSLGDGDCREGKDSFRAWPLLCRICR